MGESKNNSAESLRQRLNRIGNEDAVFIKELISLFSKNLKQGMLSLNQKNPANTIFEKQQVAHKLKSNFALFEYEFAAISASNIENAVTDEEMKPHIENLNDLLPNILDELLLIN